MRIVDLDPSDDEAIRQVASILVEGFREHWPDAWPEMESGLEEVRESLEPGRISRIAVDEAGKVLGWIGGIPEYRGRVWELHPLVVDPSHQRKGVGRSLVADFEEQVRRRGGLTVFLGSDDQDDQTTLSGVDLYPNVWEHVSTIRNLKDHPYEFYQKLGYTIVGVTPDANGWGKPDILMAKRVAEPTMSDNAALVLSAEESQSIAPILQKASSRAMYPITLESLLQEWQAFMEQVEIGYDDSIYEYRNDLYTRDLLEEVRANASGSLASKLDSLLAPWDRRFNSATKVITQSLSDGMVAPWWFRIPKNPIGDMASDLDAEQIDH